MKIAVDFISCQCVRNALETTNELRGLSSTHENREDKLQLKSHIYHTGNFTTIQFASKSPYKSAHFSDQTQRHLSRPNFVVLYHLQAYSKAPKFRQLL